MNSNYIATVGVAMLLLAFLLHLIGFMKRTDSSYLLLNFVGAGMSCYASYLIHFLPFVILEGVWAVVAAGGMIRKFF